jgi:hypothetical protein
MPQAETQAKPETMRRPIHPPMDPVKPQPPTSCCMPTCFWCYCSNCCTCQCCNSNGCGCCSCESGRHHRGSRHCGGRR